MNWWQKLIWRYITLIRKDEITGKKLVDSRTIRVFYSDGSNQLLGYESGSCVIDAETGETIMTKAQYNYLREVERLHESNKV